MNKREGCCPVSVTVNLIGGKWKAVILWHLMEQSVLRFNELSKYVKQATPKMLTQQLRELERDGLINRKVYPVVPPKVEYSLTDFGKSMAPILKSLSAWGEEYMKELPLTDI
ncbi:helix-turn-helix domain-containing protein [Clostridium sp. Marseille-Q2269]|uniref:winged helix-turn-helix transcriptional regulator n=1 Tax=Clostridium sp. Marseille-Q2269 TaxID=2942205 RepID=UPI00207351E4|nr:helix-turn-helix domain-containing protein [Clostridium sp. Marseille-Q2269]